MPTSAFEPLDLPAALWRRPDIAHALERRDIGGLLRLIRQYAGASQTRLGTAIGLAQGTVSLYMSGHRAATSIDLLERVADGLDMPDPARVRLGLAPRESRRQLDDTRPPEHASGIFNHPIRPELAARQPANRDLRTARANDSSLTESVDHPERVRSEAQGPSPEEVELEMRRRHFMHALTGVALGSASPLLPLEALRHALGQAIDPYDHDRWDAITAEYAHSYYTLPPETLCQRLSIDLGILQHLLAGQPDDRDLNRAAANLSMVLAICLTSSNEIWLARRWWGTAREAADRSGDRHTTVTVLRQQAVKGLYDGSPPTRVLALSDQALAMAGDHVDPGVAGALSSRAQALAVCGRHAEAIDSVRQVKAMTERMPSRWLNDDSMFGWPEHRLRHTESFVYTEIGDTTQAIAAQDRALKIYPDSHAGNRAMVQMHRAGCLVSNGDISTGLRYAADTLDALPADQHEQLLYEVARRAVAKLPQQERHRPDANELRERLTALPAR